MTGIVFWSDNTSDLNTLGDKTQLEFSYLIYSDVVEQDGVYDWAVVDNILSTAASRGRQVVLRFRYTYPGETGRSVPLYITQIAGYTTHMVSVEGSTTYIPDWTSTELQDFTLEFYTEFASRYDDDARLAFVQVGFGSYSEYHLYDGPSNPVGTYFPSKAYQTTFLNHLDTKFINTQWSISIDAAESDYTPISANASLKNLGFGLFDDSFLHETHSEDDDEYNRASWLSFGTDRSDTRAAGGELNYYSNFDQEHVLDVGTGPWGTSYETLSDLYDITYMIGNDQLNYQTAARIEEAGMSNGYQFEVTAFASDGSTTELTIKNNGIAPIYYDAYPAINGTRSTTSLKGLVAGESRNFTISEASTGEDLDIECDRLVSGQGIQFDADIDEEIISSIDDKINEDILVYPNPFQDQITIQNRKNHKLSVRIFNQQGVKILTLDSIETEHIDTCEFPIGVYIIEVIHNDISESYQLVKK